MRHVWSLLLALVLTPLIYMSAGISAVKLGDAKELGLAALVGLLAAFAAGGLYALLVMSRLSPVGPVVAGLIYLGVTLWAVLDRDGFASLVPADLFGQQNVLHVPVGMGTALLAGPLILTVFSSRRWRGSDQPPRANEPATNFGGPTTSAPATTPAVAAVESATTAFDTPTYPPTSYPPPTYEPPVYTPPGSAPTYTPPTYSAPGSSSGFESPSDGDRAGLM
jgi:hypothetical protein